MINVIDVDLSELRALAVGRSLGHIYLQFRPEASAFGSPRN